MKRLDPIVQYGNTGDAYPVMIEQSDGDLVWYDEAQNRIDALERELRIHREVIDSWVSRDIRQMVLEEIDRRIQEDE